ncbi:unnamed protein product, partial [Mesorhabditis spiculigera]
MILQVLFAVASAALTGYLLWAFKRSYYWKERNLQSPPGIFPFGHIFQVVDKEKPWYLELAKYTKKFGKFWGYQEGVHNVLVVADLETANEILHKRFEEFPQRKGDHLIQRDPKDDRVHLADAWGQRWKRLRSIVMPQFSNNSLKRISPIVNDSARHLVAHIGKHVDKDPINIHLYYQEYTMDVIARIAMGVKGSQQWNSQYPEILRGLFDRNMKEPFYLMLTVAPFLKPILQPIFLRLATILKLPIGRLYAQIEIAVAERKKARAAGNITNDDFIDMFLSAEATIDHSQEGSFDRRDPTVAKKLTTEEVIAQCFVFLLAGFDTTANTLAYVSHFLALNKDIQDRLREEIDHVCTTEEVSNEQLAELKFMDCVTKEGLRLHPLATVAVARVAEEDCEIAGISIDKGTMVQIDAYTLQRSKEIWGADAEEFVPDRWMNPTKGATDGLPPVWRRTSRLCRQPTGLHRGEDGPSAIAKEIRVASGTESKVSVDVLIRKRA